jgi:hypothetical protein
MAQSTTQIQADLTAWYAARRAAANGKSITISTSAGSRTISQYDVKEINTMISQLETELAAAAGTSANMGRHSFAVANFDTDAANER